MTKSGILVIDTKGGNMGNKISIMDGLVDGFNIFKFGWKRYLTHWFVSFLAMIIPAVIMVAVLMSRTISSSYNDTLPAQSSGFGTSIIVFVIVVFAIVIQSVYVKITDDFIEDRASNYSDQFGFIMKKFWKLAVVNVMVYLPIGILIFLFLKMLFSNIGNIQAIEDNTLKMYLTIGLVGFYSMFLMFVNHNIIISDENILNAIKKSVSMVIHNIGKLLLLSIAASVGIFIIDMVTGNMPPLLNFIKSVINGIFSVYVSIVITQFYKQITFKPQVEDEALGI